MAAFRMGRVIGRPKIKKRYGANIGNVQRDIRQRTRKGGLGVKRSSIKLFGFGGK